MIFVCAIPVSMKLMPPGERLFAFPQTPRRDGMTILDSGAFGLFQQGKKMSSEYMQALGAYYSSNAGDSVYCIAPDEYLNPAQSMQNFAWWVQNSRVPIVPVIQFERKKTINLQIALKQARFYARYNPKFIAISNPGLRGCEAELMPAICSVIRATTGAKWLHNLGAGWSPVDVRDWARLACFDSMDTIAYYTEAQAGKKWRPDGGTESSGEPWETVALHNAESARVICGNNIYNTLAL